MDSNELKLGKAKLELELERTKIFQKTRLTSGIVDLVGKLIHALVILGCMYIIFHSLVLLADKRTDAIEALSKIVEQINLSQIAGYGFGFGGVAYGMYERRNRKISEARNEQDEQDLDISE